MLNLNPPLLSVEQIQNATQIELLRAIYEFIVSAFCICIAALVFYLVFRFFVWFLPRYYYREQQGGEK